jgi:murein L,D-transpeptidase YcbB/YkuD
LKDSSANLLDERYNFRQYALLQKQLQKYKQLEANSKWDSILISEKDMKKNDSSNGISTIRNRLFLLGDLTTDSRTNILDDSLISGLRRFQARNGLNADGRIGKAVLQALNKPLEQCIQSIVINMERTRWVPADLSKRYLIINIPAFELYAFDQDTMSFTMNVVVGKDVNKTTIFSGDIKYIVFSPYWNVPSSILKSEILPAIKRNPNYLKKNNMEWNGNAVRQKPGPKNSLGLVKFLFPNSHNIYLHDTPAKSLFDANSRAFSHGCIRVARPTELAEYLLDYDSTWTRDKIYKAMHAGKEKYVTIKDPVPVYIAYLTAWVGNHGELNFRRDIYNRDPALEAMLMK